MGVYRSLFSNNRFLTLARIFNDIRKDPRSVTSLLMYFHCRLLADRIDFNEFSIV